ncbi:MAG: AMP-binding protein [Alphaproteobacteria bacterium]
MAGTSIYDVGLDKVPANFQPLTPLTLIERAAGIFPDRVAVIHGERRYSWLETYTRSRQLGSALSKRGIGVGDTVAIMAPNIPEFYEGTFGVPMCGAVLNSLNIRLDAETIAFILNHGEAKAILTDREFSPVIKEALAISGRDMIVIDIDDDLAQGGELIGETDYEAFIATGDPDYAWRMPDDEWNAVALNYTSGTTGNPKGVVYSHRGAYLNSLGNLLVWSMPQHPVYLWTLPMFHCNGWCFVWGLAAVAGTSICLRRVEAKPIYEAFRDHGVTHFCGAPIVLGLLVNAKDEDRTEWEQQIKCFTAASAPPALEPVPADGETIGEVMMRGNIVMKGYLKNPQATEEALAGGWFHSGDLGVMHPDGYIELKDRSKDIIISGGENISTIEVEGVLYRHPAVLDAAVVARPDEKWGETPCAFIELKDGAQASEEEIIAFCRENLASFKSPKTVVFTALPKTSTGKIQKFKLREEAKAL